MSQERVAFFFFFPIVCTPSRARKMKGVPRLRALESALSLAIDDFESPQLSLEQYMTPAPLAARLLWTAAAEGHIRGASVLDLGCGTGMLSLGAAFLDAAAVLGVDACPRALAQAAAAATELAGSDNAEAAAASMRVDFVHARIADCGVGAARSAGAPLRFGAWDTAVLNPPFGCVHAGADIAFLVAALAAVRDDGGVVYSLHKSSTRSHVLRAARDAAGPGSTAEVVAEMRFDLPATYAHHTKVSVDVDVDVVRVVRGSAKLAASVAAPGVAAAERRSSASRSKSQRGPHILPSR